MPVLLRVPGVPFRQQHLLAARRSRALDLFISHTHPVHSIDPPAQTQSLGRRRRAARPNSPKSQSSPAVTCHSFSPGRHVSPSSKAEGLQCDSPGWSAAEARVTDQQFPPALQGRDSPLPRRPAILHLPSSCSPFHPRSVPMTFIGTRVFPFRPANPASPPICLNLSFILNLGFWSLFGSWTLRAWIFP